MFRIFLLTITLVTVCIFCFEMTSPGLSAGSIYQDISGTSMATNAFASQYQPDEKVPLLFSFGYAGDTTLYLDCVMKPGLLEYGVIVKDDTGKRVYSVKPVPNPRSYGTPVIDGEQVSAIPVTKVSPQSAIAIILPDVLNQYQPLSPGKYTITLVIEGRHYDEAAIFTYGSDDWLWAKIEVGGDKGLYRIMSNPVTITIVDK